MRKKFLVSALAAAAVAASSATALGGTATAVTSADQSKPPVAAALAGLAAHPRVAQATDGQAFVAGQVMTDADGTQHVRMQRTYHGIPVLGGDLVVHQSAAGALKSVSQTLSAPVALNTKATISEAAAGAKATARKAQPNIARAKVQQSRLVIDAFGARPRLAWEVITGGTQADGTPSRLATYVDAATGAVIRSEQQIHNAEGTGQTLYSGTVPLNLTQNADGSYALNDETRGNTYSGDANNQEDFFLCEWFGSCLTVDPMPSDDNVYGDGTMNNRETAAADAQYGTDVTWDYYKQVHGRDGIFGDGSGSYNRVHYGQNYVNAFWDGKGMTYGDGDGKDFGPLVSLDVAGHEMSHGVTEHTAALAYSGESGGLNEATSDIFGTMVEFYANNEQDPGDYYIGEKFDLAKGVGFRRMDQPSSDGVSEDCWYDGVGNVDVHYSSGVGNHFFYLLAEGSGAKEIGGLQHDSPTCDGSTVTGIGREAAEKIWFRALTTYFTSGTDYHGAREATLSAATDLFGADSAEVNAVAAAWSAVAVS